MKRDIELLIELMVFLTEKLEPGNSIIPDKTFFEQFSFKNYNVGEITYHIWLLESEGLIEASMVSLASGEIILAWVGKLTYKGHEYLEAAMAVKNQPEAWKEFVKKAGIGGGKGAFEVALNLFAKYLETKLGL